MNNDTLSRRLGSVFAEEAARKTPVQAPSSPAKAYKPTHGGYPSHGQSESLEQGDAA